MKLDKQIHKRARDLISEGLALEKPPDPFSFGPSHSETQAIFKWGTQSIVFLTNLLGDQHTYTVNFRARLRSTKTRNISAGIGILKAVLEDIEAGFIQGLRRQIAAEVFSDLFDQAEHLLTNGYIAPAASLAGAALENGLRSIASREGIQVKDSDNLPSLTQKLVGASVCSHLDHKRLSGYIAVRNAADHGRFDDLTENTVSDLIRGARSFLADKL